MGRSVEMKSRLSYNSRMQIPDFRPIKQVRISEEVTEQLKQAILLGQFRAGDKLPAERVLAERFQVSRLSIREAIRKLESFGFVTTRHGVNGGVYVTDLTFENLVNAFLHLFLAGRVSIRQLIQVRLFVEPEVARLAASGITSDYAERLRQALESEKDMSPSALERFDTIAQVHQLLAEMSGNPFLEGIVVSVLNLTLRYVQIADINYEEFHTADMHVPVVEAVSAGNGEAAFTAMRQHVAELGEILLRMEDAYLKKDEIFSQTFSTNRPGL